MPKSAGFSLPFTGEYTAELIDQVLRSTKHEEQAYNSCAGILHSCKGIPHGIVKEASRKCIEMHACKYSYFKRVLGTVANSIDSGGGKSLPSHVIILDTFEPPVRILRATIPLYRALEKSYFCAV